MRNKGFIMILDAVLATILILSLLYTMDQNLLLTEKTVSQELLLMRTGYDIVNVLVKEKTLGKSPSVINERIGQMLPPNYGFKIIVSKYVIAEDELQIQEIVEIGSIADDPKRVVRGDRSFLLKKETGGIDYYCIAKFWIYEL
ncbi:MAG: hypothetical protein ABH950_08125 [Candidatus Altiarchaeota archaeon]